MHFRRALLLFTLVLGLTALAAAISPSRKKDDAIDSSASAAPARPPFRQIVFAVRAPGKAATKNATPGEHVVLSVGSAEGGIVTIPKLGLTDAVSLYAPARFDLLAPAQGRYDLLYAASSLDEPRRVGTLVTTVAPTAEAAP